MDKHAFGNPQYGITRTLEGVSFEEAIEVTKEKLAAEGFGVLTEIDVKATLKKKIDKDIADYVILGACNPPLAHQAIGAVPSIGLFLPCNVVVASTEKGVTVSAIDPVSMFTMLGDEGLEPVAKEAGERLSRAMAAL